MLVSTGVPLPPLGATAAAITKQDGSISCGNDERVECQARCQMLCVSFPLTLELEIQMELPMKTCMPLGWWTQACVHNLLLLKTACRGSEPSVRGRDRTICL